MQEKTPVISVIIPVYNTEKYLQSCIDSLLNQTMKDIEFIFINDASTDHSLEVLRKNERNALDQIKVVDLKENLCQGGARNVGIKIARGEYIGFVDSDDFVNPEMYSFLYKRALETGADVTFVQYMSVPESEKFTDIEKSRGKGSPLIQWNKKLIMLDSLQLDDFGRMDMMCYPIGGCCCGLWKKNIIVENEVYFPEHLKYEDNYWVSLIKCYISKVSFISRIMYYYRYNLSSTIHKRNECYHLDRIKIEKELLNEVRQRNLKKKYYPAWEYMFTSRYVFGSYYLFFGWFDKPPIEKMVLMIKELKLIFPEWENNEYYQELTSIRMKRKNKMVFGFPKAYAKINLYFLSLKKTIKKILYTIKLENLKSADD